MTRDELLQAAKRYGLTISPKTKKVELIEAVSDAAKSRDRAASASLPPELATGAPAPETHDLPWGYGETRITAMARDPNWLYAYWELTDEDIERAQREFGDDEETKFCLRVYDTTFKNFDGTNANSQFDVPIERAWRNYFINVGKPRSVFQVEIGIKSAAGAFVALSRSGAVNMPPDGMAPPGPASFMTVLPDRDAPRPPPYIHRHTSRPRPRPVRFDPPIPGNYASIGEAQSNAGVVWHSDGARALQALLGGEAKSGEWFEQLQGGGLVRWVTWHQGIRRTSWTSGVTGFSFEHMGPVEVWFEGQRRTMQFGPIAGGRTEFGPWRIVINSVDANGARHVLDAWKVHVTWGGMAVYERIVSAALYRRIYGAYSRREITAGASEVLIREEFGASHELALGASERMWLGASELWLGGASEFSAQGASELFALGSSETLFLGASEIAFGGASFSLGMGASESMLGGASEFGGASMMGGASELGGASMLGGASERTLAIGGRALVGAARGPNWSGYAIAPRLPGPRPTQAVKEEPRAKAPKKVLTERPRKSSARAKSAAVVKKTTKKAAATKKTAVKKTTKKTVIKPKTKVATKPRVRTRIIKATTPKARHVTKKTTVTKKPPRS